jgi:hypothetical protein
MSTLLTLKTKPVLQANVPLCLSSASIPICVRDVLCVQENVPLVLFPAKFVSLTPLIRLNVSSVVLVSITVSLMQFLRIKEGVKRTYG